MRGKAGQFVDYVQCTRITPAYAGKRLYKIVDFFLYTDHPRLCGEKRNPRVSHDHGKGSPPPMRGKVQTAFTFLIDTGITPAYAGKSALRASWQCLLEDHPRLCGEKFSVVKKVLSGDGSPPPMRGKGSKSCAMLKPPRITPAYAGKSFSAE